MIITIGNQKGGVGKTTTALELALHAQRDGHKVVVVDTDPQQSAVDFKLRREDLSPHLPPLRVIPITGQSTGRQIRELSAEHDLVVIDAGGRDSMEMRLALLTSHMALIPSSGKSAETDTLATMADLVNQIHLQNPGLKAWVLPTRLLATAWPAERQYILDAIHGQAYAPLSGVFKACTCQRVAYDKAYTLGRSVLEMDVKDSKAVSETTAIFMEVMTHV